MKRYLLISLVLFSLLSIVHARNIVVNFDMESAKLGMTPEQVKNVVNRSFNPLREKKVSGITSSYFMGSYKKNDSTTYTFDENKKLVYVERHVRYGTGISPDWRAIDAEIIKKYGKPNIKGHHTRKIDDHVDNNFSSCWGECYLRQLSNGGSTAQKKKKGISLQISHGLGGIINKSGKTEQHHTLFFSFMNSDVTVQPPL